MTAPAPAPVLAAHPAPADDDRTLPGRTTIADRAVERIAAHAVTEVDGVGGAARRLLGVDVGGSAADRDAAVTARSDASTTALAVRLSVAYPASVARTTENVRAHLISRVRELTGLTVTRVDITVAALTRDTPALTSRRVR